MARTPVAGIYVRASLDRTGDALAVGRQEKEARELAKQLGWAVAGVYRDNSVSASTGKRRPEFERLLSDLQRGAVGAVLAWHPDRLARRPDDLERLIQAVEATGAKVATVQSGEFDLDKPSGRATARTVVAWARYEIEHRSARHRSANLQAAEAGRPPRGGRRCFGYTSDGMRLVADEARAIQQAADELLAGVALHAIARGWNEHGLRTTAIHDKVHPERAAQRNADRQQERGLWRPPQVRRLLANPRLAGLRQYRGEFVASGTWPAILTPDKHYAVKAELARPERHAAGPPRRFLLSGLVFCGAPECGLPLYGASDGRRGAVYRCSSRAHVCRSAEPLDSYVSELVVQRLARPDAIELLASQDGPDFASLSQQLHVLEQRGQDAARLLAEGVMTPLQFEVNARSLEEQRAAIESQLSSASSHPVVAELVIATDVSLVWKRLSLDVQRAVVRELMSPLVAGPGRGARSFDPATVDERWRH